MNVTASCGGGGGFTCNNAVALSNGVPYNGNNTGGGSNVTTYNCQNWSETGPEKVHSFYHTGGTITVNLTETGGADVDAFLLGSCSPTNCLLPLDNGVGTTSQPAGTYYVVVDGYQGDAGSYTLTVSSSSGGGGLSNDNPCGATTLSVGSTCNNTSSTNIGATTTSNPAAISMCLDTPSKDVWFKTTIPASGIMTIRTSAGSLTDALMSLYTGSCSSLNYTNICEDDNNPGNGSYMPVIGVNGPVGMEVYIRVWGYGNSVGTFSICVLNYNSQNFVNTPANDLLVIAPNTEIKTVSEKAGPSSDKELEVRSQSMAEFVPVRQLVHTCDALVNGLEISAFNVDPKSEYFLYNTVGSILCQGKAIDGSIHCSASTSGVYFMSIVDEMGNRCVQKIFVN